MFKHIAIAAVLVFLAACGGPEIGPQDNLRWETHVVMGLRNEVKATFELEVADTDPARLAGLMDRMYVPEGTGMIFVFDRPDYWSMWMHRTYIPLDMIFMNERRVITAIAENRRPLSEDFVSPCTIEYERRSIALDGQEWDIDAFFDACEYNFTLRENATKFVVEVPAGTARRHRIAVGDVIMPAPTRTRGGGGLLVE